MSEEVCGSTWWKEQGRGSRFPVLAAVCGIALVVLLAVSPVANGSCPSNQCDFYCSQPPNKEIPFVTLFKKGDHKYECDLVHKIGGQTIQVKVAYSYKCAVAIPKKSSTYSVSRCHHNLYTNRDDVASREFNHGSIDDFLSNCIKIYIGSAKYKDGSNYNSRKSNSKSCVMVETGDDFI